MVRNKEHDFFGDKFTRNIKYADIEWQAFGSIQRGSVYTKESILHLLFEGFSYDRQAGDYTQWVPRASTQNAFVNEITGGRIVKSSDTKRHYVAAKLQHDLYFINSEKYQSSSTTSSIRIQSIEDYLVHAVALANPVFDDKSKCQIIHLVPDNLDQIPEKLTVFDFFDTFIPDNYTFTSKSKFIGKDELVKQEKSKWFTPAIERYTSGWTKELIENKKGNPLIQPTKVIDKTVSEVLSMTLRDFLKELEKATINSDGVQKTVKDIFLEDFTLRLHDPEAIKLPFYKRGLDRVKLSNGLNANVREEEDYRSFATRFINNSVAQAIHTEATSSKLLYREYINDLLEEALFANVENFEFYKDRNKVEEKVETSKDLADELLKRLTNKAGVDPKYEHLINTSIAERSFLAQLAKNLDNLSSSTLALYCADLFTGEINKSNPVQDSWGIHFVNEENTDNLFQNKDKTYKLYNGVLIGYKLVDALLSLRTALGGIYFLFNLGKQSNGNFEDIILNTIAIDVPLSKRTENAFYYDIFDVNAENKDYYTSVTVINNLYKKSRGIDISNSEFENKKNNFHSYDFSPEIRDWLENECFVFKGRVYGDYVEELNFQQDLHPDADVQFSNLRIKKTKEVQNIYQDSKYEIPYVEQTNPLVNNTSENKQTVDSHASKAFTAKGNLKGAEFENGEQTQNTIPPFLYDYDK